MTDTEAKLVELTARLEMVGRKLEKTKEKEIKKAVIGMSCEEWEKLHGPPPWGVYDSSGDQVDLIFDPENFACADIYPVLPGRR